MAVAEKPRDALYFPAFSWVLKLPAGRRVRRLASVSLSVCLSADALASGFKTKKASVMISSPSESLNILVSRNIWFTVMGN